MDRTSVALDGVDVDGWIYLTGAAGSWSSARDGTSGTNKNDSDGFDENGVRVFYPASKTTTIHRSFFYFMLNNIPAGASIVSCSLEITCNSTGDSDLCIQQGTQSNTLVLGDYDAFTGPVFDTLIATTDFGRETFTFNSFGRNYIESVFGSSTACKLCLRNYQYDFLNVAPIPGYSTFKAGIDYVDHVTVAWRPILNVTYEV
ncbi:MAG: hypothetical protein FVQ85_21675 [Planctomycetes bacterium]|nr:hypothetical protein [Planctomycetota bacterium]